VQRRAHFRFSLRSKLLLLSVAVLSLPFVGLEYLREMERHMRDNLENSLLEGARAVAGSLHGRTEILPVGDNDVPPLYVHHLRYPIHLDGYSDDWLDFLEWSELYVNPDDASSLSFRLILARDDQDLYALLQVSDQQLIYSRPGSMDSRDGDHVEMVAVDRRGKTRRFYFAPSAPGSLQPFEIEIERDEYDFEYETQRYVTYISGYWQERDDGYTLELRLPLDEYRRLGFIVHDVDDEHTLTRAASLGTAGPLTSMKPNALLESEPLIEQLIDYQEQVSGRRIWVLNEYGQVLASSGSLRRNLQPQASQFVYNLILPPPTRFFTDDLAGASRLAGDEVLSALAGRSETSWRNSPDGRAVIASAAVPILVDGAVTGAVVVEETTHQIQMLQREAMASLVNKTLLTYGLVTALLLAFAARLSLRLRNLSREAEQAIDHHGRVVGDVTSSSASDEIGDLSRRFAVLLTRLREYNDYLEGMAGRLAHELRTPLAVVQSSLENLDSANEVDRELFVERARTGIRQLNTLITRLSEAARLEQALQTAETESIDIAELLRGCIEGYRLAYPGRTFVLHGCGDSLHLQAAPDLLVQLLDKLIANADDFAEPGTAVHIELARDDDHVYLNVTNTGPPLPDAMQGQLFNSLVSVRRSKQDGEPHLGLGLYLARLIAEFHGGQLHAENLKDGSGVCFTVVIRT
jgi:two-component system, OmpR family, sensor histidine kinase ChvG